MRKLRTIRPWRLRAVRLKTVNFATPSIAESVATRAPGGLGPAEYEVKCRGYLQVSSPRDMHEAVRIAGPRGERVVVVYPR